MKNARGVGLRGQALSACLSPKRTSGFTLIEIIMVILITGVLSVAGYHVMRFAIQHTFFLPNQVQTDLAAADAMETMVEGDSNLVRGLRFCKTVTAIAPSDVTVMNQDCDSLRFWLKADHKLYRSINGAAETVIPYFMPASVNFTGSGGFLFTYFTAPTGSPLAEAVATVPGDVRRIQINLIAQQGAGSVDNFQGSSRQSTSVKVNPYTCP
jgi:prepilin-type N-terminal cleavage/methylation domain-containing protein